MEQVSHDWIENFTDFEAVLVCQNELYEWNQEGVTRAFQTYGWDDGSTPGNDSTFVHAATGVVVRHEGSLTAIEFGAGDLTDAFPDLFEILHALGWRSALVYHPTETMNALLVDMGRAIPARLDFDVQPAPEPRAISGFAEGTSLLDRSKLLNSPGGMAAVEQTLMTELRSMDDTPSVVLTPTNPITLEDDIEGAGEHNDMVVVAPAPAKEVTHTDDYYSEEPTLFVVPQPGQSNQNVTRDAAEYMQDALRPAEEPLRLTAAMEHAERDPQHVLEVQMQSATQAAPALAERRNEDTTARSVQALPSEEFAQAISVTEGKKAGGVETVTVVKVGNAILCFDCPSTRMSDEEISSIANEHGFFSDQLVYLRPGVLNERMRWNVMGEIVSEHPGFAEKLVELMRFECSDRAVIAAIILAAKANNTHAQLRDALTFASSTPSELAERLSTATPATSILLTEARGDRTEILTAVLKQLGPLALIPAGQSFVDYPDSDGDTAEVDERVFTIRELLHSPEPRMFVFHVDELDSPFVDWIVQLLRAVACLYSKTKRYKPARIQIQSAPSVQPVDVEKVRQESTQQALAQVSTLVGGLYKQLQQMVGATDDASMPA